MTSRAASSLAFYHSAKALEFATNHIKDLIFRGKKIRQHEEGHIDMSMRNYAFSMKTIAIEQSQQLDQVLTEEES